MLKTKYLIIGAGVSGLGFANFVESENYLILEKDSNPGGYCRTIQKGDYIWDYAGHFFHFANQNLKTFFTNKINAKDLIYKNKITKILYKNEYIDYPFQKNIHQLPKSEFIDCLHDLFNREEKTEYLNFMDMLYGKYGKSITEKFLRPYNEKLYSCDLNSLDADAIGRFFPKAEIADIINNMKFSVDDSYNKDFFYPKKGAVTYINALLKDLNENKILFNQEVISIDLKKKIVKTVNNEYHFEYLINSAPFNYLIKFIDKNEFERVSPKLTYNKVLVLNLGFDKKSSIDDIHWVYVPDKSINFYRFGFYDNILDFDKLSMYVEISYKSNDSIDVNSQLKLTIENLKKIGVITDHILIDYSSVIMNPAYVHISLEANKYKLFKKSYFEKNNVYSIGRYGDWKYCSIEDSILDALNLAKKLN